MPDSTATPLHVLTRSIERSIARPDPRLAAAEAVAACALHLVMQWHAWESLNRTALAALNTRDQQDTMAALRAYELLDSAVQAWAPHLHPAIGAASHDLTSPPTP